MMKKLLFIPILLLCTLCYADISSISGTTISGSSFGSKTTAAPIKFSNFNDGTDGAYLKDIDTDWINTSVNGSYYSTVSYSGDYSISNNVTESDYYGFATNRFRFTGTDKVYYYYKYRIDITGNNYAIVKQGRITAGADSNPADYGQPNFICQYQPASGWTYVNVNPDSTDSTDGIQKSITDMTENEWNTIEMYWSLGTAGNADGEYYFILDGNTELSSSGVVACSAGETYQLNSVILGTMATNLTADGNFNIYVDDVYVDNTQARVMIGNASTLSSSTHREIQIPSAWATDSITVIWNQGTFNDYETVYLFVIDSNGTASDGYEGYFVDNVFYSADTVQSNVVGRSYGYGQSYGDGRVYSS